MILSTSSHASVPNFCSMQYAPYPAYYSIYPILTLHHPLTHFLSQQ